MGKRGDVVTPAALKAAGYFVPPLWKRATDPYDLRAYYALKPETYFNFQDVAKAPITLPSHMCGAQRDNDARIKELEDEILARRASGS